MENEELEDTIQEQYIRNIRTGIVTNCSRLNIRKEPNVDSDIVCSVSNNTEVIIDEESSNDGFYKITTSAGIEGFCMKKYIEITM